MRGSVFAEDVIDRRVYFLNKDVIYCPIVVDVCHFAGLGLQIVRILNGTDTDRLCVAQNCDVHFGNCSIVSDSLAKNVLLTFPIEAKKFFVCCQFDCGYQCSYRSNVCGCGHATVFILWKGVNSEGWKNSFGCSVINEVGIASRFKSSEEAGDEN